MGFHIAKGYTLPGKRPKTNAVDPSVLAAVEQMTPADLEELNASIQRALAKQPAFDAEAADLATNRAAKPLRPSRGVLTLGRVRKPAPVVNGHNLPLRPRGVLTAEG